MGDMRKKEIEEAYLKRRNKATLGFLDGCIRPPWRIVPEPRINLRRRCRPLYATTMQDPPLVINRSAYSPLGRKQLCIITYSFSSSFH